MSSIAAYARFRRDRHSTSRRHRGGVPSRPPLPTDAEGSTAPRHCSTSRAALSDSTHSASAPTVAIVGSRNATDYGVEMAKYIARGLAASGVTVAAGLFDGIAVAAHAGALEADGRTVAVVAGGVDTGCPARRRSLYRRINRSGCAVSELPCGCAPRRWAEVASERVLGDPRGPDRGGGGGRQPAASWRVPGSRRRWGVPSQSVPGTGDLARIERHTRAAEGRGASGPWAAGRARAAVRPGDSRAACAHRGAGGSRASSEGDPRTCGRRTRHSGEARRSVRSRRTAAGSERARADGTAGARRRRQICT